MVKQWPAHKTMWQSAHTNPAFVGTRSFRFSGITYFAQAFPDCNAFRWPHGLIVSDSSDSILAREKRGLLKTQDRPSFACYCFILLAC